MSYASSNDFVALLRNTSGGMRLLRMPSLDFVIAALARANMFQIWIAQTPPPIAQLTTLWFRPAINSTAAEGAVYLYNTNTLEYELATPLLWAGLFTAPLSSYVFQAFTTGTGLVAPLTTLLAIERAAPTNTVLTLPPVAARGSRVLQIVDWSTGVTGHEIDIVPAGGETVMKQSTFKLFSTADQLAGVTLYPSSDLVGWAIAP